MGRLEDVCLALGISIAVGRFLVCFLLSIPAGFIHRFIGPVTLRHAWATISGLILSYYAFGATANYLLAIPVLMAYGSMLADRKHCGLLTTVSTFIYLIACHVWYMSGDAWKGGGIDFTGSLMILTLKVTSCAMNYQDGLLPPERLKDSQRAVRLTRLPSLLEFFGYILNCGTHFAGPVYEMSDYLAWSERTGVWSSAAPRPPPQPFLQTGRALLQALLAMVVYLRLFPQVDLAIYSKPHFAAYPFWRRLATINFATFVARWKYYFIWSISEAALVMSGLGFSGWKPKPAKATPSSAVDNKGTKNEHEGELVATWGRAKNADILGVELATSAVQFPMYWNMSVSNWLRIYVYERLTPKGKKPGFWQLLATQVTSAIWHGLYPGYAMYFVGTAIFIAGSKVIYGYQKAIPSDAVALRRICTVLHWFYAQLVNNYSAIGFLILNGHDTMVAYKSVYFAGTILPLSILLIGKVIKPPRGSPRVKKDA